MSLSFFPVEAYIRKSFLAWLNSTLLPGCTRSYLPTQPLAQPLAVVNNAKVDTFAMTLQTLPLMLLCTGAEIQWLRHVAISFLII